MARSIKKNWSRSISTTTAYAANFVVRCRPDAWLRLPLVKVAKRQWGSRRDTTTSMKQNPENEDVLRKASITALTDIILITTKRLRWYLDMSDVMCQY